MGEDADPRVPTGPSIRGERNSGEDNDGEVSETKWKDAKRVGGTREPRALKTERQPTTNGVPSILIVVVWSGWMGAIFPLRSEARSQHTERFPQRDGQRGVFVSLFSVACCRCRRLWSATATEQTDSARIQPLDGADSLCSFLAPDMVPTKRTARAGRGSMRWGHERRAKRRTARSSLSA